MNEDTGNSPRGLFTFAGMLLVAAALGAGAWHGHKQADQPTDQQTSKEIDASRRTATGGGKVANTSPSDGETILQQPRYIRPPELFDPLAALTTTPAKVSTPTQANIKLEVKPRPPTVSPAGWAGTGNPIQRMWEGNSAGRWEIRATPLSPKNWRISGVVQRGAQTQVIVQFDEEPTPKFYKIGDTLPGGAKLAWVKPDVIGVIEPKSGGLAVPILDGQTQTQAQAPLPAANPKASAKP